MAILWQDAHRMLEGNLFLLTETVEVMRQIEFRLWECSCSRILRVFLIGDGNNFPDFSEDLRFI